MKFKRIIVAALLLSIVFSLNSCTKKIKKNGVTYHKNNNYCSVVYINDFNLDSLEKNIYVPDFIEGKPVTEFGIKTYFYQSGRINCATVEAIYFPWSISKSYYPEWWNDGVEYVIAASAETIVCTFNRGNRKYVMPRRTYEKIKSGELIGDYTENNFPLTLEKFAFCLPANISYYFNHEEAPNDNYFFIDLLEETGKLTKPPYDPKREGYIFDGWYKNEACTEMFNFDSDMIEIKFDEEGNRIYEEICLYAGWEKEPTAWEKITDWFKSLFN